MDKQIYIIKFLDSSEHLIEVRDNFSKEDSKYLDSLMGSLNHYNIVENNIDYTIIFATKEELQEVYNVMYSNEIHFEVSDVTTDVLYSKVDLVCRIETLPRFPREIVGNELSRSEFYEIINKYKEDNLSIDFVLDKILLYGVESLNENEKLVLK